MSVKNNMARGDFMTLTVPAAAAVQSDDLLVFGTQGSPAFSLVGIAQEAYTPPSGRTTTGKVSVAFVGVFLLSVVGKSSIAPGTGRAINPGDPVFADGGTLDATTGVTYGCTINANSTNGYFVGNALDAVVSGATTVIRVRLKGSGGK